MSREVQVSSFLTFSVAHFLYLNENSRKQELHCFNVESWVNGSKVFRKHASVAGQALENNVTNGVFVSLIVIRSVLLSKAFEFNKLLLHETIS